MTDPAFLVPTLHPLEPDGVLRRCSRRGCSAVAVKTIRWPWAKERVCTRHLSNYLALAEQAGVPVREERIQ